MLMVGVSREEIALARSAPETSPDRTPHSSVSEQDAAHAALAWCLVWLMAPEIGVGPFLV